MWLYILIFLVSCIVLAKAGTFTVRSLSLVAGSLKISEFTVSFLLMAFTTTFPELFVGLTSAFQQKPQLAFGNIMGSNVVHLTLLVAIAVFLGRSLKAGSAIIQRTAFYVGMICFAPLLLMLDGRLSRLDGVLLLLVMFLYFHRLVYYKERFSKIFAAAKNGNWASIRTLFRNTGLFLIGVVLLLISAQGIVWASLHLASEMGISLVILGAVLLGLSTNLPEIIFGIKASGMGHPEMILGNIMGAVAVNAGMVLGLTALISPFRIANFAPYVTGIIFTVLAVVCFSLFTRSGKEISRKEGLFLLFIYLAFVVVQFLIG